MKASSEVLTAAAGGAECPACNSCHFSYWPLTSHLYHPPKKRAVQRTSRSVGSGFQLLTLEWIAAERFDEP